MDKKVEQSNDLFFIIERMIKFYQNRLKFNTKQKAIVTAVNVDGTVNLNINGEIKENVKVRPGLTISINNVVWLELPNSNLKDAYVDMIIN
jgi:hypothetical protein